MTLTRGPRFFLTASTSHRFLHLYHGRQTPTTEGTGWCSLAECGHRYPEYRESLEHCTGQRRVQLYQRSSLLDQSTFSSDPCWLVAKGAGLDGLQSGLCRTRTDLHWRLRSPYLGGGVTYRPILSCNALVHFQHVMVRVSNDDVSIQDKVSLTSGKSVTAKYKRTEHTLKT